jgi:hypothetical protein
VDTAIGLLVSPTNSVSTTPGASRRHEPPTSFHVVGTVPTAPRTPGRRAPAGLLATCGRHPRARHPKPHREPGRTANSTWEGSPIRTRVASPRAAAGLLWTEGTRPMIRRLEQIVQETFAVPPCQRLVIGWEHNGRARTYRLVRPPAWPVRLARALVTLCMGQGPAASWTSAWLAPKSVGLPLASRGSVRPHSGESLRLCTVVSALNVLPMGRLFPIEPREHSVGKVPWPFDHPFRHRSSIVSVTLAEIDTIAPVACPRA